MSYPHGGEDRGDLTRPHAANIWTRGLIMLALLFCMGIANSVLYAIAVAQFLWMLLARERNDFLAQSGRSLGVWLAESARFLSGDTEEKPFPWKRWPAS